MRLSRPAAWLAAAFCAVLRVMPALAATPWTVTRLMQALAQVKSVSGRFEERQTLHMLNAPLVSTGTLSYRAPDQLQKITFSPFPERFVLEGDRVTMVSGPDQQIHSFTLAEYPEIGGLVEGIRATLAGDLLTLDRYYALLLTGDAANWQLLLRPKSAGLTRFVKWIRIVGSENRISAIDTEESDGDRSEMSIVEDVHNAG